MGYRFDARAEMLQSRWQHLQQAKHTLASRKDGNALASPSFGYRHFCHMSVDKKNELKRGLSSGIFNSGVSALATGACVRCRSPELRLLVYLSPVWLAAQSHLLMLHSAMKIY